MGDKSEVQAWHMDYVIENATGQQMDDLAMLLVHAAELSGLRLGGAIHPFGDSETHGECQQYAKHRRRLQHDPHPPATGGPRDHGGAS